MSSNREYILTIGQRIHRDFFHIGKTEAVISHARTVLHKLFTQFSMNMQELHPVFSYNEGEWPWNIRLSLDGRDNLPIYFASECKEGHIRLMLRNEGWEIENVQ